MFLSEKVEWFKHCQGVTTPLAVSISLKQIVSHSICFNFNVSYLQSRTGFYEMEEMFSLLDIFFIYYHIMILLKKDRNI